ncbi:MAG: hypothetical protein JO131_01000 [Gammaproteobacteria bacterium]|nr:hypothetical protein [Gammaproteobacteria bacterium]
MLHTDIEKADSLPDKKEVITNLLFLTDSTPWRSNNQYTYIRIPTQDTPRFYIMNNKVEGEGENGKVYKSWLIIPNKGELHFDLRAIKITNTLHKSKKHLLESVQQEANILAKIYVETEKPFVMDNQILLITKYIPGKTLINNEGKITTILKN